MIVKPTSQHEWSALMQFLNHYALVQPTADMKLMGWVVGDNLKMVVGLNGFMGKVCQMHVAMAPDFQFTPKEMLKEVFKYAFLNLKIGQILGLVNSLNEKAMNYDQHLGFTELWRLPKMHDEGGDIVIFGMTKDQCRYLYPHVATSEAA